MRSDSEEPKFKIVFEKTIMVFGAGAHAPYDFPVSATLTEQIKNVNEFSLEIPSLENPFPMGIQGDTETIENTTHKLFLCRFIKDNFNLDTTKENKDRDEFVVSMLTEFIDSFAEAQVDSIDVFLAKLSREKDKKGQIALGKLLIAYFVWLAETKKKIGYHRKNWISHFTSDLLQSSLVMNHFFSAPPKIFTFNYDNFLEKSLFGHLVSHHRIEESKAIEMIKGLNIVHIYGDIGTIENGRKHGDPNNVIKKAIERIHVIGEERGKINDDIHQKFLSYLRTCDRIYFMGFKFDPLNADQLFGAKDEKYYQKHFPGRAYYSTHVDLYSDEIMKIRSRTPVNIDFPYENNSGSNCDCSSLIEDARPIFTYNYDDNESNEEAFYRGGYDPFEDNY